ncbi:hypothetical protein PAPPERLAPAPP_02450 [Brevundimonas phage vB_BpoS-Papperlapapp]|nr:hypothetical protein PAPPERLAPAPP_02450 [Brevundimonas phage vB_BpoS-Papperlapapp]
MDTTVPTADLKQALRLFCPYAQPAEDPDRVRGEAAQKIMTALGLTTLAADPFDGMLDEQRRVESVEGPLIARQSAVDDALAQITQIEAPLAETPENWPEEWEGKPFANVTWDAEEGGPFLCIGANQAGTILGDFLGGLTIEGARGRILQALFLGGLTATELVLHERENTPLFQQAHYHARLALAGRRPRSDYSTGPIALEDYVRACRAAGLDLSSAYPGETGELMAEPWFDRAEAAERRMNAGARYL